MGIHKRPLKRSTVFVAMFLVVLALVLAACGKEEEIVSRPTLRLQVNDQSFSENIYQYCWPEAADDLDCNIDAVAMFQPLQNAAVRAGDTVRFVLSGTAGTPQSYTANVLGGFGDPQDLNATDGVFNVDLQDDTYRVQVDVQYADIAGQPAYISYVFGLEVAGVVAMPPTPTPTPLPTETPLPTVTPTPLPTATLAPTLTPVPTDTPAPTEPLAPTNEPSPEAAISPEPAGVQVSAEPTAQVLAGSVRLSSGGTTIAVAGASVSYTHETAAVPGQPATGAMTTAPSGEFTFAPILLQPGDQVTVRAEAPGYQAQTVTQTGAQVIEAGGYYELILEPLPTPVMPTATATRTSVPPTPTATTRPGVPSPENVPVLTLSFGSKTYTPVGYRFCEPPVSGEPVCTEQPYEEASPGRISMQRGTAAQLKLAGSRPDNVHIEYLTDTGITTGQPENRQGDTTILLTITPEPGSYIMAVRLTWSSTDVTYFFRVTITD